MSLAATILPTTTFTTLATINGEAFKGDGYYGYNDGLHTVCYFTTGFVGVITMQAALVLEPADADWFDVDATEYGDGSTVMTGSTYKNFTGNFVWVRVRITEFSAGTITKVLYNL